jgi:hypothetical protein
MPSNDMTEENGKIFCMERGRFARALLRRFCPWWLWVAVGVAVLCMMWGFIVDLRWVLAGFFVLLVAVPHALAVSYYNHALCRECFVNVLPHTIDVDGKALVVTLYEKKKPEDGADEPQEYAELRRERFDGNCVRDWWISDGDGFIGITDKKPGFIWVPKDADNFLEISNFARNNKPLTLQKE